MSNVYVFNATSNAFFLNLNNFPVIIGTNNQLAAIASSTSYVPSFIAIGRVPGAGNPQEANFGGQNTLQAVPVGGGAGISFTVNINSSTVPIAQDVQLYLFYDKAVLVTAGEGTDQVIPGTVLSVAEVKKIQDAAS